MAVLLVSKFDIRAGMAAAYVEFAKANIPAYLNAPGLIELRGYRPIIGSAQVAITFEFADLAAFAIWRSHPEVERVMVESRQYGENICMELWGPSPVSAAPLRP